jgi:hypothetical protein
VFTDPTTSFQLLTGQIEFVRDKKTKIPFDPDMAVAWRIHELGTHIFHIECALY